MAATNLTTLNPSEKTLLAPRVIGTGAPADGDDLSTLVKIYPIGSTYIDKTNHKFYFRDAVNGVAADWVITN